MINYNGMKAEESSSNIGQLPVGVYVAKTLDARIEDGSLVLYLDVAEGDYQGFYMRKFEAQKAGASTSKYGDPRYKGTFRLRIPQQDGPNAEYYETNVRRMNDMGYRYEQSNPGYRWDGNELKLKGKLVGINVQEDTYNGNTFTRIGRLEIVDDVRNGLVKPMKPRQRKEQTNDPFSATTSSVLAADPQTGFPVVEEELPF